MQITGNITPDSLMTLEAYAKWRKTEKPNLIAHRRERTVLLGDNMSLQFESERTIRYQIQEMLRIERIFEEEGIRQEVDAYKHLVPDGTNWKATMMIEYPDVEERRRALARLIDVEDHVYIEIEGLPRVYAIADEDLDRENDHKTSAVHFLRFEFNTGARDAIRSGRPVSVGCDHENYRATARIPEAALASLASDLH